VRSRHEVVKLLDAEQALGEGVGAAHGAKWFGSVAMRSAQQHVCQLARMWAQYFSSLLVTV